MEKIGSDLFTETELDLEGLRGGGEHRGNADPGAGKTSIGAHGVHHEKIVERKLLDRVFIGFKHL